MGLQGFDMTEADLRHILSSNIKKFRSLRSLTQIELAEKANISIPFLSNIERSNKWPHPETLVKIAQALNVEVYMLFQEKLPDQSDNVRNTLVHYKNDVLFSMHKTVLAAIDNSIEAISSHYIDDNTD